MEVPIVTTQVRHVARQLGTLAGAFDYWQGECRRREGALAGHGGVPYQHAAMALLESVQRQRAAIVDLRDGAAHTAVCAGWCPVRETGDGER